MIEHILFDLDGTLTDPADGITGSVAYALKHLGHPPAPRKELERFIGPPLDEAFGGFYGFDAKKIEKAVELFREYFSETGIWENEVFLGIPEMLAALRGQGKTLHIATSKPTVFAKQILARFNLAEFFTIVEGSPLTHNGLPKGQVVEAVLKAGGISPKNSIMVGDRRHDVAGAHQNHLPAVGVLFGYGSREELQAAGADYIAESVPALQSLLLKATA